MISTLATPLTLSILTACALAVGTTTHAAPPTAGSSGQKVFELRTYYTHPGRLDALNKRFREHTCKIFQKHGMELVGFWTPRDGEKGHGDTLVYLLAFPSREAADKAWENFGKDPEWKAAKEASEKDGPIVKKVERVFLDPTDYSAIK
ncbi:MAG: NIPSNAP family protein [Isosphaeraceae bacterium]